MNPITDLPVNILMKATLNILNFKQEKQPVQIDYTKDSVKSILDIPFSMSTKLYNFQKLGIEFGIKKKGRILLADEMGVGKTIQAIGIASVFSEDWPVLVICPSSLKYNWRDEILSWLPDMINEYEVQVLKSSKEEFRPEVKFYIISYDLSTRHSEAIKALNFKIAIADEVHYLKNKDAKRTSFLVPVLQRCKRLLLLSGTPILAKPVEVFPLLQALRPDLFTNFKAFTSRYCDPKQTAYGLDYSGASNSKELYFILSNVI